MKLSQVQEKIVNTSGNLIVRASAGTGKTFTMVQKIAKEIDENHTHKVIAAITFTIKAAQEIKDRLTVDTFRHFIGTNNSFAIEEVIKPFIVDVFGEEYDLDINTDYSLKVNTFQEAMDKLKNEGTICSLRDSTKNFVFDLAQQIVENSLACRLYLQSRYFKIYIDEYQDCDCSMHKFFMYLCDVLGIETFVVGDEKQSIYIWRGAYPKAFTSIWEKPNFKGIFMGDNFRSCQQIQNYSNLLCLETRDLYRETDSLERILWIRTSYSSWAKSVLNQIDLSKKIALLRFKNDDASNCADQLSANGAEFVFIRHTPIADITTNASWLYLAIAKYLIVEKYSVYNLISEIPVEGNESKKVVSTVKRLLIKIEDVLDSEDKFFICVEELAGYLGYETQRKHIKKLYETIINECYHSAFEPEKYDHITITFHSSKGLEFDQVIIFAEDYRLGKASDVYNHYVAATRAKSKLIIVDTGTWQANAFSEDLEKIFNQSGLSISNLVTFI